MNGVLWNVFLAVVWAAITGNFGPDNLALGFVLGFVVLYFARRAVGDAYYAPRLIRAIRLGLYFLWELFLANLRVAAEVLTPGLRMRPGVVAVPLDVRSDVEIVILASLVALTPGSLSLDVSEDRRTLYVHFMDVDDPESARRKVKEGFERRVMAVFQ